MAADTGGPLRPSSHEFHNAQALGAHRPLESAAALVDERLQLLSQFLAHTCQPHSAMFPREQE
jgi:hypothetical protein